MKALAKKKLEAISLRKKGYSLKEITILLGIAQSTASIWAKNIELSDAAKDRIQQKRTIGRNKSAEANKKHTEAKMIAAREQAKEVLKGATMNADTRRLICSLLYWCEGAKIRRGNTFGFTNSDPYLVRMFLALLRQNFLIDDKKLRLSLHLHEYHDMEKQLMFWSEMTSIPRSQCHRPYLKPHTGKRSREGYQGCATIKYFDTAFARQFEAIAVEFLAQGP